MHIVLLLQVTLYKVAVKYMPIHSSRLTLSFLSLYVSNIKLNGWLLIGGNITLLLSCNKMCLCFVSQIS